MSNYNPDEVLSITYEIWISNVLLAMDKKLCINSIEIKETVEGSDSAIINLSDPDFLYIEDDIFIEDNPIRIRLGWDNTTYRVDFDGYISAIDINFDSSGIPKIVVVCMDKTHLMNRSKKNETFNNCTNADVVKKIVQKYGYSCVIDNSYSFTLHETITQSNQTDIEFITKLANDEVYPFTARLVGNTFYYVKIGNLEEPKMSLVYKSYPHDIISFSPKINKETKQVEIKSASVNTKKKSVSSSTGIISSENKEGGVSSNGNISKKSSYTYNPNTKTWSREMK